MPSESRPRLNVHVFTYSNGFRMAWCLDETGKRIPLMEGTLVYWPVYPRTWSMFAEQLLYVLKLRPEVADPVKTEIIEAPVDIRLESDPIADWEEIVFQAELDVAAKMTHLHERYPGVRPLPDFNWHELGKRGPYAGYRRRKRAQQLSQDE